MRAKPAVTIGWRVLWLVAAVWMRMRSLTAPAAPHRVAASFWLYRSEMKAVPRPSASPSAHLVERHRGTTSGWPART